jgi:uncharacterized protein (TIGR02284 family)
MRVEPQSTINTLNELIAALRDSQECLRKAAEKVESEDLKLMLMEFSTQRAHFLGELQNEIERLGNPDPRDTGTVSGTLHRTWMQLKAMLTSDHDQAILAECEHDESAVVAAYGEALTEKLPRYIRDILESQLEQIGLAQAQIRHLRRRAVPHSA